MRLAPIGVFCLLLPVVVQNGPKVLLPLLSVIIAMAVGCTIHAVCVYSSVAAVVGHMSPVRFSAAWQKPWLLRSLPVLLRARFR